MLVRKAIRSVHGSCDRGRQLHTGLSATATLLVCRAKLERRAAVLVSCRSRYDKANQLFSWTSLPAGCARVHPGLRDAGPLWGSGWQFAVRLRVWLGRLVCKLASMPARVRCAPCHPCWTGTALRLPEAAGDMCCMLCRPHLQQSLGILSSLQQ